MAKNFRFGPRENRPVASSSAAVASGQVCVQEGIFGIAQTSVPISTSFQLGTRGVWNIPVPTGTVKGDVLYAPGSPATAGIGVVLTKTSTANTKIGRALSARDASLNALVELFDNSVNV